ncbi:MAG TPA: DUF2442 domain-containing protein [Rhizobiaceae bacterium]|nr:DUF2442 domain-containing protein [Rhizobiaceae bacterium]
MIDRNAFRVAVERGRDLDLREPRAKAARYDRKLKRVVVDLTNGASFAFPPAIVEGLETATDTALSDIEILGDGYGLHWEALDVDYTVPGLLAGIFGTRSYLAAEAGRSTSAAKARAARANGAKGGRPRKSVAG